MSKVTKNSVIERIDTDKVVNDVVYLYATPELAEDDPAHSVRVSEQELIQYCLDFELAEDEYGAVQLLHDAFEDIVDQYWDNVQEQKLFMGYKLAIADAHKVAEKQGSPLTQDQWYNIQDTYGIQIGRRAA